MLLYVDRLYTSPYAMSVFVGMQEKGIPFEVRTVDLDAGGQHAPDYAAQSLTQRVPTLVDGDFRLSESSAITEYLDDVYPGVPLYPADAKLKARARQVQAWLRSDLLPIRQERSTDVIFLQRSDAPLSPAAQVAAQKLFDATDALLADGAEYLFGAWSIADVDLALMLHRLIANGDAVPPKLVAYAQRQWQRPTVQAWVSRERAPLG
ncbi:glutathione S-transferase [Pseudoduganella plicata]|uniref:Glutathione S-transferase n=1 Tax=Pseudoduganella plicata TaxID=321984 RepID=A0A4P7BJC7_9BURK|nr:glutathione transferase [Pseudoduganella plicata]QBQ39014.1 glutathione transferase [Pseudoduganella plicata]GGY86507.1 glutathione S-transferase [Pseudoduganella plicata]